MRLSARKNKKDPSDTLEGRYLIFQMHNSSYGVALQNIIEITGMHPILHVFGLPKYIIGVVHLKRRMFPVIDIHMLLNMQEIQPSDRSCIIVLDIGGFTGGLIVEGLSEIRYFRLDDIVYPVCCRYGLKSRYIKGVGKSESGITFLLDCRKMVGKQVKKILENID